MTSRHKAATTPQRSAYRCVFVESMPDTLDEGILYVCMRYATSAHNCFCGCGREVIAPIHPTKWKLTFDGVNVSLFPSVGSWSLPCKSHYWLQDGVVDWADSFSEYEIEMVRGRDSAAQDKYFTKADPRQLSAPAPHTQEQPSTFLQKVSRWLLGK
jgi:hypothetical protein